MRALHREPTPPQAAQSVRYRTQRRSGYRQNSVQCSDDSSGRRLAPYCGVRLHFRVPIAPVQPMSAVTSGAPRRPARPTSVLHLERRTVFWSRPSMIIRPSSTDLGVPRQFPHAGNPDTIAREPALDDSRAAVPHARNPFLWQSTSLAAALRGRRKDQPSASISRNPSRRA